MHIRDPIHGSIEVDAAERRVIDSRFYQRLRNVKQLGFSDLAFPGATHSRYSHGIGAMSVGSRLFDALYRDLPLPAADKTRLRRTLRLAVLLHDLGHPPLSHTSERILPMRTALGLPSWTDDGSGGQASHEEMTLLLLLQSGLADLIRSGFADDGIEPEHVAALVCGRTPPGSDPFRVGGVDHAPLLRQLVSSELDADRMDYLLRDSFYTGVHYGRYDLDWIVQNVLPVEQAGALYLGVSHRAVFAFEDFLLSRYHMFLSVYYHYASINYEQMLGRYYETSGDEFVIGPDPESYVLADDVALVHALRQSGNPWAKRIVDRRGFSLVVEVNPFDRDVDVKPLAWALESEGIAHFVAENRGVLSKYFADAASRDPILVQTSHKSYERIERYTPLFARYAESSRLVRVYVDPDKRDRARALAGALARPG
jgi:HD superfamily phosphohydrolase